VSKPQPLTQQGKCASNAIDAAFECADVDGEPTFAIHMAFVVIDDFFRWVNIVYSNLAFKLQSDAVGTTKQQQVLQAKDKTKAVSLPSAASRKSKKKPTKEEDSIPEEGSTSPGSLPERKPRLTLTSPSTPTSGEGADDGSENFDGHDYDDHGSGSGHLDNLHENEFFQTYVGERAVRASGSDERFEQAKRAVHRAVKNQSALLSSL